MTPSSAKSIEDAVEAGMQQADATLDEMEGVWVQDIRGLVKDGKVSEWRAITWWSPSCWAISSADSAPKRECMR